MKTGRSIRRFFANHVAQLLASLLVIHLSLGLAQGASPESKAPATTAQVGTAAAPQAAAPAAAEATKTGKTAAATAQKFPEGAEYVGEERCVACHTVENDKFSHTAHAKAFRLNPKNDLERRGCEACHGPGSRHANENYMDKSLIVSFTREATKPGETGKGTLPEQINGICLQCHEGNQRIFWRSSTHQTSGLACTDCHNPMAKFSQTGLQKTNSISETCYSCHQQQRMEFRKRSHMPLPEGKMSCADCHNPHGSPTKPLLKADTVNQLCYSCHQEKRGPFLWEHAPVRESCLNCHGPHGSNQEKLLTTPRPFLCQQCHTHTTHQNNLLTQANTANGSLPDERVIGRSCSTCHAQVHGSNHPAGARMHR